MAIRDQALTGKVALVTGGSRGIGRAVAVALGGRGARVVLGYRENEEAAREAAAKVRAAGGQAVLLPFDVADVAAVERAVKQAADQLGRLDILVTSAGVAVDGLAMRLHDEDWQRALAVNLTGAFSCCRAAAKHLTKARDGGRIVAVTSVVGETGGAGQSAYAAAKAGLIGLVRSLARELATRSVTVNAISPGYIDTDMTAALPEETRTKWLASIPLGRPGRAEEIGDLVAFLAGPEAAYITGQVIRVNGGLLM